MDRISNIEAAILGLLSQKAHYGYELDKLIEERGMRNWAAIGFSSIYYVLRRLENKGLVESRFEGVEGKPSRRIYTITEQGRNAIRDKVKTLLSEYETPTSSFDLGIANIPVLEPAEMLQCLDGYLHSIDERLAFLEKSLDEMKKGQAPYFVIALFTRPIAHLKTQKAWVKEFMEEIKSRGGKTNEDKSIHPAVRKSRQIQPEH